MPPGLTKQGRPATGSPDPYGMAALAGVVRKIPSLLHQQQQQQSSQQSTQTSQRPQSNTYNAGRGAPRAPLSFVPLPNNVRPAQAVRPPPPPPPPRAPPTNNFARPPNPYEQAAQSRPAPRPRGPPARPQPRAPNNNYRPRPPPPPPPQRLQARPHPAPRAPAPQNSIRSPAETAKNKQRQLNEPVNHNQNNIYAQAAPLANYPLFDDDSDVLRFVHHGPESLQFAATDAGQNKKQVVLLMFNDGQYRNVNNKRLQ